MHIGLFFGSFNPVHIGHMALANYMLCYTEMEEIWFVVSPQNPLKKNLTMLDQHQRLALVNIAIDDFQGLRSSNIEFSLSQPSYTVHTLAHLAEKYPQHRFSLIMGQDNLKTFDRWKNYEEILRSHQIYVYPRPQVGATAFDTHPSVHLTAAPQMEISSTFIRNAIREKKNVRFFLPDKVWAEIDTMNYYRG